MLSITSGTRDWAVNSVYMDVQKTQENLLHLLCHKFFISYPAARFRKRMQVALKTAFRSDKEKYTHAWKRLPNSSPCETAADLFICFISLSQIRMLLCLLNRYRMVLEFIFELHASRFAFFYYANILLRYSHGSKIY